MEEQILESLKCPICVEIFSAEVYQCMNGHIICSDCSVRITDCPECRVRLNVPRIRNRFVENVLDVVKFDCEFKNHGCTEKLSRTEILEHSKKCLFGDTRLKLCQLLGFSCDFLSCNQRIFDVCKHFKNAHQAEMFENYKTKLLVEVKPAFSTDPKMTWKPVMLTNTQEHMSIVLVQICTSREDKSVRFYCVEVAYNADEGNNNRKVDFFIKSENPSELPDVAWSSKIFDIKYSAFAIKNLSFRIPYQAFLKYSNNGFVTVDCSIEKDIKQSNLPPTYCTVNLLNMV